MSRSTFIGSERATFNSQVTLASEISRRPALLLQEEGNKWQLCQQKELSEDGVDFQCDDKRSEDFHWKEGDTAAQL